MKDKVIWSCSSLLFAAGVVWGKLSGPADFFKVSNIHDLFEILGATATVIAASVAVAALSGWKGQFAHTEKYRLVRDFHSACQSCWNSYWYVTYGFDLIPDAWKNKNDDNWFYDETEPYRNAMNESSSSLQSAFLVLKHHLSAAELEQLSSKYWEYMNQVSYGCSEIISYTTHCRALIEEPKGEYLNYIVKGSKRLQQIGEARENLCAAADVLFAKYAQPK